NTEHGLGADALGPEKKLEQAETVGGTITPGAHVAGTLVDGTDGFPPLETRVDDVAFEVVAAGEAQKLRLHVDHHLHEIGAEAVGTVDASRREKGNKTQPRGAGLGFGEREPRGRG